MWRDGAIYSVSSSLIPVKFRACRVIAATSMLDPTKITVGQVISGLKDIGFLFGLLVVGWKFRTALEPMIAVIKRLPNHLDRVEDFMFKTNNNFDVLMTNHIKHMEADLKTLSGRDSEDLEQDNAI